MPNIGLADYHCLLSVTLEHDHLKVFGHRQPEQAGMAW